MLVRVDNKTVRGLTFLVRVPTIHHVKYEEGDRTASVEIEGGLGKDGEVNWLLYSETLRGWDAPHEAEDMPMSKRQQILDDISKSMDLLGMPHEIV